MHAWSCMRSVVTRATRIHVRNSSLEPLAIVPHQIISADASTIPGALAITEGTLSLVGSWSLVPANRGPFLLCLQTEGANGPRAISQVLYLGSC